MSETSYPVLLTRAVDFAARAHAMQRRKDAEQSPYVNHLAEVARLLAEAGSDINLVIAGYLHDAIEDVGVSYETIVAEFGKDVADLVQAATDDKTLPKAERKRLQVLHAPAKKPREANLKLADKISNLRAIYVSPPVDWPEERRRQYIEWAHEVVSGLQGVNPVLMAQYEEVRTKLTARIA